MKKVIDGSLYNTETAKMVGEYEPGYARNDFHFYTETLYVTKAGKFFLHGEGNAASPYNRQVALNEWTGGEKIIPAIPEEARKWAEENLTAQEYADYFGEPEEASEEKIVATISILKDTKRKLEAIRQETGQTISGIIDELVASK